MEQLSKNIDRLATTLMCEGDCPDRWIIPPLYDEASAKLKNKPISLVAAQRLIKNIHPGDTVFLLTGFGAYPNVPFGETDGPLGVASLARAIWFGLGGIPVIIAGHRDMNIIKAATKAAGFNVSKDFDFAKKSSSAIAVEILFPIAEIDESEKFAKMIIKKYKPKAVIAIETAGPNIKGIKHYGGGTNAAEEDKIPRLEHLFYEANNRKILTIGIIDLGNELGSGTIIEKIRQIVPNAKVCKCPCASGIACIVNAEIVYPVAISNFGAYAITAMMGALLRKPEILHSPNTERRMLNACIMEGAVEGLSGAPIMAEDGVDIEVCEGYIRMLHSLVERNLKYAQIIEVDLNKE